MTDKKSKGKVLIVGAGITGTTLAALLEQHGSTPDVIEKMPSWEKVGYGITIMPAGLAVLRKLQLIEIIRHEGTSAEDVSFITPDGTELRTIDLIGSDVDSITLRRGDLHKALRSKLRTTKVRLATTVKTLKQTGDGVVVTFSDGSKDTYDFVVGADGVNSAVRGLIFPRKSPEYPGAAIWTFFLPHGVHLSKPKTAVLTWGEDGFMGVFPIKGSAAVTFAVPLNKREDVSLVDLTKHFETIHSLGGAILNKMKNAEVFSGHLKQMRLGRWYKGRVVLAGDAAHASMPSTGMGASMGMQDALVLSELLAETIPEEWHTVPALFQKRRKKTVDLMQREAYLIGRSMFLSGSAKVARNTAIKLVPNFVVSHELKRTQ